RAAFADATEVQLTSIKSTMQKRLELSLLQGQRGLGIVAANDGGVLTITDASWSAFTWADMEGAVLEAWTTNAATATQHNGDLTISAVDFDAKTVTVTGTSTNVVQGDYLFFKGAKTATSWRECAGLVKIGNHTSGDLFSISATTYSRWRSNVVSSLGPPTMLNILQGLRKARERGFRGLMTLMVPAVMFEKLNTDLAGSRRFDGSYQRGKAVNGFENITFHGTTGPTEIMIHPLLWDSQALAIPFQSAGLRRVGAYDQKYLKAGADSEDIWFVLQDYPAHEARYGYDQAIIAEKPSTFVAFNGATYS